MNVRLIEGGKLNTIITSEIAVCHLFVTLKMLFQGQHLCYHGILLTDPK